VPKEMLVKTATFMAVALLAVPGVLPAQTTEIEVPTSGATASFAPTRCGVVASTFGGRVVRRAAAGPMLPIANATFTYTAEGGAATSIDIPVGADGRFDERVVVAGPTYTFMASGVSLAANAHRMRLRLTVEAPGCAPTRVTFHGGWEPHDVVLRCTDTN